MMNKFILLIIIVSCAGCIEIYVEKPIEPAIENCTRAWLYEETRLSDTSFVIVQKDNLLSVTFKEESSVWDRYL